MIERLLLDRGISPKKVAATNGGEFASPCPSCGGRDRFRIWPSQGEGGTWFCRGCGKGGDCIEFLRHFDGLSFGDACRQLGLQKSIPQRRIQARASASAPAFVPRDKGQEPLQAWTLKASRLLDFARERLRANPAQLELLARRGLPEGAVERYALGWLPGENGRDCYFRSRAAWGLPEEKGEDGKSRPLWLPAGLVVPALDDAGRVSRLRVRRSDEARSRFSPEMKYVVIPGSSMHPLLLRPQARAFVVVEAELDAMACAYAADQAGLDLGALAVGTNMGKPDSRAHAALSAALAILVALDFDQPDSRGQRAGARGLTFWAQTYRQARRWPTPCGKDPGDAAAQGVDLALWLKAGLPPVFSLKGRQAPDQVHGGSSAGLAAGDLQTIPCEVLRQGGGHNESQLAAPLPGRLPGDSRLFVPAGPLDSLRVLARAGLRAEPCVSDGEPDYTISGQETWNMDRLAALFAWLRQYGHWVHMGLYGDQGGGCHNG